jgi:nucleotide-binding universal stress UspA family protein
MRILVAVDLADPLLDLDACLDRAAPWAARVGGQVDLFFAHLQEPPPFPADLPSDVSGLLDVAWARLDDQYRHRLDQALHRLPEAARGRARVERGDPWGRLLAVGKDYDLVVLTTHGRSGVERAWFGSMTEHFIARSPVPTLVLHPTPATAAPAGPLRALIGLDLREDLGAQWRVALPWLTRLGEIQADALFSQADPVWPLGWESSALSTRITADWLELLRVHQDRLYASMLDHLPAGHRGGAIVRGGDPAAELVLLSADYDLVVVGTHRRTGFDHLWSGSVSERVVRRASGAVLVIPGGHDGA